MTTTEQRISKPWSRIGDVFSMPLASSERSKRSILE